MPQSINLPLYLTFSSRHQANRHPPSLLVLCLFFCHKTICTSSLTTSMNVLFASCMVAPSWASFYQYTLFTVPHLYMFKTSIWPFVVVPLPCSFLILSTSSYPKRISTSLTLLPPAPPPVFWSVPPSSNQTTLLVSLPSCKLYLLLCCYSFATDHSWHLSTPTLSCLQLLPHLFTPLPVSWKSLTYVCT